MASIWPLYHKGLIGRVLQRWLSFWKVLPSPQKNSVRVTIRFFVTSLTKALLPRLLSLAGRSALGRLLVVLNFFNLGMMEVTVCLVTFYTGDIFWYPSLDLCLDTILSRSSTDNSFELMVCFFPLTCSVNCETLYG